MKANLEQYIKKLKRHIESENLSVSAWAKNFGFPQPVISRLLAGKRGISLLTAMRIQVATGGKVRIEDLCGSVGEEHLEAQSA